MNKKVDYSFLESELKQGIVNCFEQLILRYQGETIYAISFEIDDKQSKVYVYINTEENFINKLKDCKKDKWYFRFCEYEWYIFEEGSVYFNYIWQIGKNFSRLDYFLCLVNCLSNLRQEKYFEKKYDKHEVMCILYAYDLFDANEISDIMKRINYGISCEDYIENMECFV